MAEENFRYIGDEHNIRKVMDIVKEKNIENANKVPSESKPWSLQK